MRKMLIASVLALSMGTGLVTIAADDHAGHGDKKEHKDQDKGPATTQAARTPVNKYCAVEGKGHAIDPKVTTEYKGQIIGFCCAGCIPEFHKDPEKYVKNME
jgi:YHS domain-containing protein